MCHTKYCFLYFVLLSYFVCSVENFEDIKKLNCYHHHLPLSSLWNSPGRNTGVGSHSLLQEIFPTQGLNLGLLHCRQILYCLSHQGNPLNTGGCGQIAE